MHSGFQALRGAMPMNIRSRHPGKGMSAESQRDIDRIVALWSSCRERFGKEGPLLFGRFSIADAYYAPVVTRFQTYAVELPRAAQVYCDGVYRWPDLSAPVQAGAMRDELYRVCLDQGLARDAAFVVVAATLAGDEGAGHSVR